MRLPSHLESMPSTVMIAWVTRTTRPAASERALGKRKGRGPGLPVPRHARHVRLPWRAGCADPVLMVNDQRVVPHRRASAAGRRGLLVRDADTARAVSSADVAFFAPGRRPLSGLREQLDHATCTPCATQ